MKEEITCEICGKVIENDETYEFEGKTLCQRCFDDETVVCNCCGERMWSDNAYMDSSVLIICDRCYDDYYYTCDNCGRLIEHDEAFCDDSDTTYCQHCYDELEKRVIKQYHYKPSPIFYGDGTLFMGVELEVDKGGECDSYAAEIQDIANIHNERIYIKHDGSIDNGFEIVSHPMTFDYHSSQMNWSDIFETAIHMGYRSHQTSTCGLHVHVNRTAFGDTFDVREEVIARIIYFVEKHWNELLKFSRRTEANINRWANRYGLSENTKNTYSKAKNMGLGRYVAVNLENLNTVEFRLFRGTLRYPTFIATLQLVYEICKACINKTNSEIEKMTWGDFVLGIDENNELIEFLKSKQLYVNELTNETEEV